jgi:hypothetical protein
VPEWSSDPNEAADVLSQWAGGVVARFALDASSVSEGDVYEAVGVSLGLSATTDEELLNPRNPYIVDLFCTP